MPTSILFYALRYGWLVCLRITCGYYNNPRGTNSESFVYGWLGRARLPSEWAKIEVAGGTTAFTSLRRLGRIMPGWWFRYRKQAFPDTSGYTDPEIVAADEEASS